MDAIDCALEATGLTTFNCPGQCSYKPEGDKYLENSLKIASSNSTVFPEPANFFPKHHMQINICKSRPTGTCTTEVFGDLLLLS